jgi:cysteine sulfinate desulfinase/cysteine desulfurase-like protein
MTKSSRDCRALARASAQHSIRLSLGKDTTNEDINFTVHALAGAVERLRAISNVDSS